METRLKMWQGKDWREHEPGSVVFDEAAEWLEVLVVREDIRKDSMTA